MTTVNLAAGEYVRRAVDVLRLVDDDDIGIVYLAGFPEADEYHERKALVPPFPEYFPERPNMMYRTPMRRIFDPSSGTPLSQQLLERFGELFDTWALKQSMISGLPVAMERLAVSMTVTRRRRSAAWLTRSLHSRRCTCLRVRRMSSAID